MQKHCRCPLPQAKDGGFLKDVLRFKSAKNLLRKRKYNKKLLTFIKIYDNIISVIGQIIPLVRQRFLAVRGL